jgi:predicted nucleic acid-binding protein
VKVIIDADAFLVLRRLGLLRVLLEAPHVEGLMLQRAARYELSDIQSEVQELEGAGLLRVEALKAGTAQFQRYKSLTGRGVDKGEAEAIAWAGSLGEPALFVTQDKRARTEAAAGGVVAIEAVDVVALTLHEQLVEEQTLREACGGWDDRRNAFGRPKDWSGFDGTMAQRIGALRTRGVSICGPE